MDKNVMMSVFFSQRVQRYISTKVLAKDLALSFDKETVLLSLTRGGKALVRKSGQIAF